MKFAAAVVVYNISCSQSSTCRALENLNDPDILVTVYDNSTSDFGNREYCSAHGFVYLGGTGNVGISKAYNAVIDFLEPACGPQILCLFDDDTHIDASYFSALRQCCESSGKKIFVPLIYAGERLISPCILKRGHRVLSFADGERALDYDGNDLSAINSCMALDLSLFENYRYDEAVFLDGVDHHFISEMRKRGEQIAVFPYRCRHSFSGMEKPSLQSALTRFRIYAKDYKYILKDDSFSYFRLVGKRALKLTFLYKTPIFLKYL